MQLMPRGQTLGDRSLAARDVTGNIMPETWRIDNAVAADLQI